jgi:hypothetical protein
VKKAEKLKQKQEKGKKIIKYKFESSFKGRSKYIDAIS